jgi:hypothetical protein
MKVSLTSRLTIKRESDYINPQLFATLNQQSPPTPPPPFPSSLPLSLFIAFITSKSEDELLRPCTKNGTAGLLFSASRSLLRGLNTVSQSTQSALVTWTSSQGMLLLCFLRRSLGRSQSPRECMSEITNSPKLEHRLRAAGDSIPNKLVPFGSRGTRSLSKRLMLEMSRKTSHKLDGVGFFFLLRAINGF